MILEEITPKLAALMYYSAKPKTSKKEPPVSFEILEDDQKKLYLSLAESVLNQISQLNLKLIPKGDELKEKEIEAYLRDRIEGTVSEFFDSIKIWKKDLIPQEELVAKLYQMWATL